MQVIISNLTLTKKKKNNYSLQTFLDKGIYVAVFGLNELGLFTLEKKRLRGTLSQYSVLKIQIKRTWSSTWSLMEKTKGNENQLHQERLHTDHLYVVGIRDGK